MTPQAHKKIIKVATIYQGKAAEISGVIAGSLVGCRISAEDRASIEKIAELVTALAAGYTDILDLALED